MLPTRSLSARKRQTARATGAYPMGIGVSYSRRQPETRGHKCPPYANRHGAYQFLCVNNDGDFVSAECSLQSRVGTCCPRVLCLPESKPHGQRVPNLWESVFPSLKGSLKRDAGGLSGCLGRLSQTNRRCRLQRSWFCGKAVSGGWWMRRAAGGLSRR